MYCREPSYFGATGGSSCTVTVIMDRFECPACEIIKLEAARRLLPWLRVTVSGILVCRDLHSSEQFWRVFCKHSAIPRPARKETQVASKLEQF